MFCPSCGSQIADGSSFCAICGKSVTAPVANNQPAVSMGWYKFLIYFALWAGAFVNILLNGIPLLTGSHYGDSQTAELVYAAFEGLKSLDMICGILAIALGVFDIYTRFQLAAYKEKAPILLTVAYCGAVVFNLIYVIGCTSVLPEYVLSEIDFTSFYSGTIVSAVMIFVNMSYFKKRAHLFVNN